ncbi:hypothetical protein XU18_3558 [Perkinsela sp. CCAP 1560/4]|nr:hypothetical protein XU18_3558 [Perkinsela sp. CCAP 1560/4]|eukprot:KNH05387.1 hypothetical protein XU18_3558 [Perkinsela sp. CCAP 1560/4]
MNRLVGPVELTELPRKLRTLDLWDNCIRQSVIFFGNLQPNSIYICFKHRARANQMLLMLILNCERKACPVEAYVYLNTSLFHLALLGLHGNRIVQGDAFKRSFSYICTVAETKSFRMSVLSAWHTSAME